MKAYAFVIIASVVSVLLLVTTAHHMYSSQRDRRNSCEATLTALATIEDVAAAGIRPVLDGPPDGTPPYLRAAFIKQIESTKAENRRRMDVIREVRIASEKLRNSQFCE